MKQLDVLIIGAGAVGNAIAREIIKKHKFSVGVLEKEPDTAFGISGRNSGVLHAGFNNKPGSLMAKLCVQGSEGFEKEAAELGVTFKKTGKLVIARFEEDMERLRKLKEQGEKNDVRELRVVEREELEQIAGYEAGIAALWSGMTGIFDPFEYTIALAEASVSQGAEYFFGRQVISIAKIEDEKRFRVTARNLVSEQTEEYTANVVINSAGLYSDEISRMAGINDYRIYPCRGEYHILSKQKNYFQADNSGNAAGDKGNTEQETPIPKALTLPVYPIPNEKEGGLGVHLTPSLHGNIIIGPSAEYLSDEKEREDYSTTRDVMDKLREEGAGLFPGLDYMECIRSFSGIRPKLASEEMGGYADFVIEEGRQVSGLIQLIGIESPGLTSSIPIGKMVARMAEDIFMRNGQIPIEDSGKNISKNESQPAEKGDQKMLCRCEGITEATVLEAYDRILKIGAIPTVKGLKNRSRVTMGNCQGSFCTINIIELLEKKRGLDPFTLLWNGFGSHMFEGRVRG